MIYLPRLVRVLIILAVLSPFAFSQFNASLQGTVKDPSGSGITDAHVKIRNTNTNATAETTTSDVGFYRFNQLAPGAYTMNVDAKGFKSSSVSNVAIAADVPNAADISLTVGDVSQSVTVTGDLLPTLQTADANVSSTIDSRAIESLPSFGRDPYQLIRTAPGITGTGGRDGTGNAVFLGNTTGPGGSSRSLFQTENQVQVSANGQRVTSNVYEIDGVSVNSLTWGGAAVVTPNSESVQDMTIVANSYSAVDGRNSGAHIKVTSKSGSDEFHGSGVFRFQDPNFNAYNKWGGPNNAPAVRVDTKYRQYGGSIGGPIKKDKLFFFFSYEGLTNHSQSYGQNWVLTPQFRQQVTEARPNSILAKIFQTSNVTPRILAVLNNDCSAFASQPQTQCRAVDGGLDIGSLQAPLGPGNPYVANTFNGGGLDNIPDLQYVEYYSPTTQQGNQYNGRVDYQLTSKDLIAGSVYFTNLDQTSADAASASMPSADVPFKPLNSAITGIYIHTFSPVVLNELRSNFTRFADNQVSDSSNVNWGIPRIKVENFPFGALFVAGAPQGDTTPSILAQNTYETRDTLTWVRGGHTFHFGGQFRWEQNNDNDLGGARPLYSFSGLWNLANDAPIFEQINASPVTGGAATAQRYFRTHTYAGFIQDDWHVASGLTLNLGLRYEFFSPITEARNQNTNILLGASGPYPLIDAKVVPVNHFYNANYGDVMPKFGFAYSPKVMHDRVVLRGGFGIAYNRQNDVLFSNSRGNPPGFARFSLCCGTAPAGEAPLDFGSPFANGQISYVLGASSSPGSYPANAALATGIDPRTGSVAGVNGQPGPAVEIWGAPQHLPDPYTYLYSFEVQSQLANDLVLTLGYQGSVSHHLIRIVDQNLFYEQNVLGQPPTSFYAVYFPTPDVNSSYNGFNVHLLKRFAKGFSLDGTYTWSKSIDMLSAEGPGGNTNQTDPANPKTEYGPSDYDSRHRFAVNGLWELPGFRSRAGWVGRILGGWQLGGILTYYTGFPWTPVTGEQNSVAPVQSAATINPTRPIGYYGNAGSDSSNSAFINGANFGGTSSTSNIVGSNYFNISQAGPPGIGRNSFRGPNFFSTDASLAKRFHFTERIALELRMNAYNVFNQLNLTPFQFGDNDTHVENANFGRPSGALSGRTIELQGRFTF